MTFDVNYLILHRNKLTHKEIILINLFFIFFYKSDPR